MPYCVVHGCAGRTSENGTFCLVHLDRPYADLQSPARVTPADTLEDLVRPPTPEEAIVEAAGIIYKHGLPELPRCIACGRHFVRDCPGDNTCLECSSWPPQKPRCKARSGEEACVRPDDHEGMHESPNHRWDIVRRTRFEREDPI